MSNQEIFEKQLKDKINLNITYAEYAQAQLQSNCNQYYLERKVLEQQQLEKQKLEKQRFEEQLNEQRKKIDKDTEAKWKKYMSRQQKYYSGPLLKMAVKEHGQPYKNNCNIN